jgi:hypothetical protein
MNVRNVIICPRMSKSSSTQTAVMTVKRRLTGASQKVISRIKDLTSTTPISRKSRLKFLRDNLASAIYFSSFFLLTSGLVKAIANSGDPGINASPIVTNAGIQNFTETLINFFIFSVGSFGVYAIYVSGRQRLRTTRSAEMFL